MVTGESLGQVSQRSTIWISEQSGLDFPVLRPSIGLTLEIEHRQAHRTYEISIRKSNPCSLVPYHPATMATPELIRAQEKRLDIESVARRAAEEVVPLRTVNSSPS